MSSEKPHKDLETSAVRLECAGWAFGDYRVEAREGRLWRHSEVVPLTPKAFEALLLLLSRHGRLVRRDELVEALWPDRFVDDANLTGTIWLIRRALGQPPRIQTVPKRGYCFVGDVRELRDETRHAARRAGLRTIAVLPFRSLLKTPGDELLEVGMADALITRLGPLRRLLVRPISAGHRVSAPGHDPIATARSVGVDLVIDGSLQRQGTHVRVTVRLLAVTSGLMLWAQAFDLTDASVFVVQDAIAEQIVDALALHLTDEERQRLTRRQTGSVEAYRQYLQGRQYWLRYPTPEYDDCRACFERAIAADPAYVQAHIGLANYFSFGAGTGLLRPAEAWPLAQAATATALALDDTESDIYNLTAAERLYLYRDWKGAERAFARAIDLNPYNAEARTHYGRCLVLVGRIDEALAEVGQALTLDPVSLRFHRNLGLVLYHAGRYDDAIDQFQKTLRLDPAYTTIHEWLGNALEQQGSYEEAMASWHRAITVESGRAAAARLVTAYQRDGLAAGLKAMWSPRLKSLEQRMARGHYVPAMHLARAHQRLGNLDQASGWLDRASEERNRFILELPVDPQFGDSRANARVSALLDLTFGRSRQS